MARDGVRFDPPPLAASAELRWLLLRSFGPPEAPFADRLDGARAIKLARDLDLAPRLATRTPAHVLVAEVGSDGARTLTLASLAAEAMGRRVLSLMRRVAEVAADLAEPVVALKFAALALRGRVRPGERSVCDLDVLLTADGAERVERVFVAQGFSVVRSIELDYHRPMLVGAGGLVLELHVALPGVHLPAGAASLAALEDAGLLEAYPELPGRCFLPTPELLLAHVLVHGVAQHGFAPLAYPFTRMLADLIDLGLGSPDGEELLGRAAPLISGEINGAEGAALRTLCTALAAGDVSLVEEERSDLPEAVLLRHAVLGPLDKEYQAALKLRGLVPFASRRSAKAWLAALRQAVFVTDGQIVMMHGAPTNRAVRLWWRLCRPFQLLWRLVGYLGAAVALRLRGRWRKD